MGSLTRRKFTVAEYDRMVEVAILTKYDQVELIRGEIILRDSISPRHAACSSRMMETFSGLGERAMLSVRHAVRLADSEPEPDLALLVYRDDYYVKAHPASDDVHLIVEVADSSQFVDREVKAPLYAENAIREYWLVDLAADRIEVYRDPENGAYRTLRTLARGETVAPLAFPDLELRVDDLLP